MTLDLDNMTRSEFDKLMTKIKDRNPKLFQFIIDFLDDKVTPEEVYDFSEDGAKLSSKLYPELQSEGIA